MKLRNISHWSVLIIPPKRFVTTAIIILSILPIVIQVVQEIGFNYNKLYVPVVGALMYMIYFVLTSFLCPDLIKTHNSARKYTEWCLQNRDNLNFHSEFSFLKKLDAQYIKDYLKESDYLYPLSKGLDYALTESINIYSAFKYEYENNCLPFMRWVLSLLLLSSVIMMNFIMIIRLVKIWGI